MSLICSSPNVASLNLDEARKERRSLDLQEKNEDKHTQGGGETGEGGVRQAAASPSLGRHASCNSERGRGGCFQQWPGWLTFKIVLHLIYNIYISDIFLRKNLN